MKLLEKLEFFYPHRLRFGVGDLKPFFDFAETYVSRAVIPPEIPSKPTVFPPIFGKRLRKCNIV